MYGNIVLNFRDENLAETEFSIYADSYYKAAEKLVGYLSNQSGYSDADACPIFYLYRHAIELYLKHICFFCKKIAQLERIEIDEEYFGKKCCSHKLKNLYDLMKDLLIKLELPADRELDKLMEKVVDLDLDSFNFRYPTNKNGIPYLQRCFSKNIFNTSDTLKKTCYILKGGCLMIENVWDRMCEVLDLGVWVD